MSYVEARVERADAHRAGVRLEVVEPDLVEAVVVGLVVVEGGGWGEGGESHFVVQAAQAKKSVGLAWQLG